MSVKHPIIAITGSSGAGTSTVMQSFQHIFRREKLNAQIVEGDSFHRYDRLSMRDVMKEQEDKGNRHFSHFGPEANLLAELEQLFIDYGRSGGGKARKYLHDAGEAEPYGQEPGTFTPWQDIPAGTDLMFYEGLHGAYADDRIEAIAVHESRIVLSRDRELLKRRAILHACFPHALDPPGQFREVRARFGLAPLARPFTRCLACNAPLRDIDKRQVLERLPASVRVHQQAFRICDACRRVYWQGSHWRHMRDLLATLLAT